MKKKDPPPNNSHGPIAWMARNKVAPTMLMLLLLIGGILIALQTRKQASPNFGTSMVSVQIGYPGANPTEVEEGVLLSLEDGLRGVPGVSNIMTTAYEQFAMASIIVSPNANPVKVFQDVKNAIDRIVTFSQEAERPVVELFNGGEGVPLMSIVVYGDQNKKTIHSLAERVQDELITHPEIGGAQLSSVPMYEMSIEIPIRILRAYNLTLDGVASIIRESSEDLPAGEIEAQEGKIILQSLGRKSSERDFSEIPITTTADGTIVKLGDIAEIHDGFIEADMERRFNGHPAVPLYIYQSEKSSPDEVSKAVRKYIQNLQSELPSNTHIEVVSDTSSSLIHKLKMIQIDAFIGIFLVTVFLGIVFEVRVALWIALCIPVALSGAFLLMPFVGATINMISVCAFLVAFGIIIDNGVVMGESIYSQREDALDYLEAANEGASKVALPIFMGVAVNALGFIPLLLFSGESGKYFNEIPLIAISVFIVSLIQTLFILPSQLAVKPKPSRIFDLLNRPKIRINTAIQAFIAKTYIPFVHIVLGYRKYVFSGATVLLLGAIAVLYFGILQYVPYPFSDPDEIIVSADLPQSAVDEDVRKMSDYIYKATQEFLANEGKGMVTGILQTTGTSTGVSAGSKGASSSSSTSGLGAIQLQLSLVPKGQRPMPYWNFVYKLREKLGNPVGITSLTVSSVGGANNDQLIFVGLSHRSSKQLEAAAKDITQILSTYHGVTNIDNGLVRGKRQFDFKLLPAARSVGITSSELGRQIRAAFYGSEALRTQRGRNKVSVMVRLPKEERKSLDTLNKLIIRSPDGQEMFLSQAASIKEGVSPTMIERINGQRQLSVRADFIDPNTSVQDIMQSIKSNELPLLLQRYPGLTYTYADDIVAPETGLSTLLVGFLFVGLFIYTLLAILLKSYLQPILILILIPFELIGPIYGHLILGYQFSIFSLFGVIALTGILVNTALMMMVTANQLRADGYSRLASIRLALIHRVRAVMLTAIATFLAIAPFLYEKDPEASTLIPMTISLGVGVIFSMFISLAILPALYLLFEDIRRWVSTKARHVYLSQQPSLPQSQE